ncbi:fibronectin type III domain-containing protein [Arthrobacter sp. GMC3]|uniref:fibronectin type III domain-containing protein n=1 Tax=Arthrobacter sp. GMC3 TaxID=2058894 RepID=UPI000CE44FD7|nr:fibronectin type III domain-containing protein [Arthrobacter sp. GMC3]
MRRFLALSSATALLLASTVGLSSPAFATTDPTDCGTDCAVATPFVLPPSAPGAPTGLMAILDPASGGATLSWLEPADNGGEAITSYVLEKSTSTTDWGVLATLGAGVFSYNDDATEAGEVTYYRVAAWNSAGMGLYANTAYLASPTVPGGVTSFGATNAEPRSTTLSWGAPTADGGAPITGYTVQFAVTNYDAPQNIAEDLWSTVSIAVASPFTVTGLVNNTDYVFRIRPVNAVGSPAGWEYAWATPQPPNYNYNFAPNFNTPAGLKVAYGTTLTPGTQIVVSQSGLPVGAKLTATLQSSAGRHGAGTAIVDGSGAVMLTMVIPSEAPDGEYSIFTDLSELPEGYHPALSYSAYFDVKAASAGNTGSGSQPGSGVTAAPAVAAAAVVPVAANALANTGASATTWIASTGALLLLAGFASRLAARRRRV